MNETINERRITYTYTVHNNPAQENKSNQMLQKAQEPNVKRQNKPIQ
jgi:hypothetical protein